MDKTIEIFLQGARHKSNGDPCEDRTYTLSKNGVDVISLADGAGSKEYTHAAQGAECVTKTICEFLCKKFDEVYETEDSSVLSQVIMTICQTALKKRANELGVDNIIALSSTLLCIAVKGDKVISCHIGDGAIGCITENEIRVVSGPENGEFASTTYFITLPQADEYLHIDKFEKSPEDAVYFLMSDGTTEYAFNEYNNTFLDGAGKLALLVYDENGQAKLEDIVQNVLINKDKLSDDCSFIALRVRDIKPELFSKEKALDDNVAKETPVFNADDENSFDIANDIAQRVKEENISLIDKNKRLEIVVIVLSILVVLSITFCIQSAYLNKHSEKDVSTTSISAMETTESTTEGSTTNAELSTSENVSDSLSESSSITEIKTSRVFEQTSNVEQSSLDTSTTKSVDESLSSTTSEGKINE